LFLGELADRLELKRIAIAEIKTTAMSPRKDKNCFDLNLFIKAPYKMFD